jgi:hypothetical protein
MVCFTENAMFDRRPGLCISHKILYLDHTLQMCRLDPGYINFTGAWAMVSESAPVNQS